MLAASVETWIQAGSTAIAAAAAVASWLSVIQSRQVVKATTMPSLHAQALMKGTLGSSAPRQAALTIYNAGGGVAKAVGFLLVSGSQYALGFVGAGFLRSGQMAHVGTQMVADENGLAIVICRDLDEQVHAWNLDGEHKVFPIDRDHRAYMLTEVWEAFYPDVDLDELTQVGFLTAPD